MYAELREIWSQLTGPGAPFEVTEVMVRGLPTKTYATAPKSLREVWLSSAAHGDKDYLVYGDERWTFAEAHQEVVSIAAWLVEHGVQPGDRVGIAMRNYPEWMMAYWGTICVGASAVGLNAWWTAPEMIYGIEDFDGNLTRKHLRSRSNPYNTYRISGLPMGPIASPGIDALRAALEPADTDYLYFVSRNDGTHKFSRTYREHNQAVRKFQLRRRSR